MSIAVVCIALLGILVFGLGVTVSMMRGSTQTIIGHNTDPRDRLHKWVRAHGNAAEYAPMLAVLMLALASRAPSAWVVWTCVAATVSRYLHAAGMVLCPSLDRPYPLRFVGALGTYITGFMLAAAVLAG